jgi:hypothetical protein
VSTDIKVPDYLPILKKGKHINPADGACIMEYISVLAGESFTDRPKCVHHRLAHMARGVNDYMGDDDQARQLLLPLVHRLMGTGGYLPPHQDLALDSALSEIEYDSDWSQALHLGGPHEKVRLLVRAIDAYDRITGRRCPDPLPKERLRAATMKLKVGATVARATPTFTVSGGTITWGNPTVHKPSAHELEAMLMAYAKGKVMAL